MCKKRKNYINDEDRISWLNFLRSGTNTPLRLTMPEKINIVESTPIGESTFIKKEMFFKDDGFICDWQ